MGYNCAERPVSGLLSILSGSVQLLFESSMEECLEIISLWALYIFKKCMDTGLYHGCPSVVLVTYRQKYSIDWNMCSSLTTFSRGISALELQT